MRTAPAAPASPPVTGRSPLCQETRGGEAGTQAGPSGRSREGTAVHHDGQSRAGGGRALGAGSVLPGRAAVQTWRTWGRSWVLTNAPAGKGMKSALTRRKTGEAALRDSTPHRSILHQQRAERPGREQTRRAAPAPPPDRRHNPAPPLNKCQNPALPPNPTPRPRPASGLTTHVTPRPASPPDKCQNPAPPHLTPCPSPASRPRSPRLTDSSGGLGTCLRMTDFFWYL